MNTHPRDTAAATTQPRRQATETPSTVTTVTGSEVTKMNTGVAPVGHSLAPLLASAKESPQTEATTTVKRVSRGLSASVSSTDLQRVICLRALLTADRFRVMRTVDVAVTCFPERPYKAALSAAQRAVRGMVKAGFLRRYKTERFQTTYALAQRGVDWLHEAGHAGSSSVRRVSDMTNPEHRLWAQFLVLASEARGLDAKTEQELLQQLNKAKKPGDTLVQGLLRVTWTRGKKSVTQSLRPDAVAYENDGLTWVEVDRSKRGPDREAALAALTTSVGRSLADESVLRRVVVFCKSDRIEKRALAVLHGLAKVNNPEILTSGRRHFLEVEPGIFEVWTARESKLKDGRTKLVDTLVGHVIIQLLPTWLPRVRIDSQNMFSMDGWFDENYLPYRRPASMTIWPAAKSPLLSPPAARPI